MDDGGVSHDSLPVTFNAARLAVDFLPRCCMKAPRKSRRLYYEMTFAFVRISGRLAKEGQFRRA
jgi:hypothetical protein